jgi:hypothetical protein
MTAMREPDLCAGYNRSRWVYHFAAQNPRLDACLCGCLQMQNQREEQESDEDQQSRLGSHELLLANKADSPH